MPKQSAIPALSAILTALDKGSRADLSLTDKTQIFAIGLQILTMKQRYEAQQPITTRTART